MTPLSSTTDTEAVPDWPQSGAIHVRGHPSARKLAPCVACMVDPRRCACAVLPEAALLAHSGARAGVANGGGEVPAAALAHDISPVLVLE
ncbi:MAG: hypothetical protein IPM07_30640 [Anaerolineales bacterium]|nr:hypothetical protein [Anaerolineales bacterium]